METEYTSGWIEHIFRLHIQMKEGKPIERVKT